MSNIYIDIFELCDTDSYTFHILQGGRGTGKTFSALTGVHGLRECKYKPHGKYILLRRTEEECTTIASDDANMNPFKKINRLYGSDIACKRISKKMLGIFNDSDCTGSPQGYIMALSTFAKVRGADFDDVGTVIMDEFVPEDHVRLLRNEGDAYFNMYETVCRNREFDGERPVQMFWLSNSNNIYNPLLDELNIINDIERLSKTKGCGRLDYADRGLEFFLMETLPEFRVLKSQTALSRLTAGTRYSSMALDNRYSYNDFSLTGYRKLTGYSPLFAIDDIYVYHSKDTMYACYSRGDVIERYKSENGHDRLAVARRWRGAFTDHYMAGRFYFETYQIKHKLLEIIMDM